jgi:hypothetical protein
MKAAVRGAALLVAVGLVAGCAARTVFYRPDATPAQHSADAARCEYEIEMNQRGVYVPWWYSNSQALGYTLGAAIGMAIRNDRLRTLCMQSMGYTPIATGAAPTPIGEPQTGLVGVTAAPAYTGRGDIPPAPPPPVAAAPAVAGLRAESRWQFTAEGVAKAEGCNPPTAAMTSKGAGQELFAIACPNGTTLAIRCEVDGCRVLR